MLDHLHEYFGEMLPIFCNVDLSREHLSEYMRTHVEEIGELKRRHHCLVGTIAAKKNLLMLELLSWYMLHGVIVTHVYQVLEFAVWSRFSPFADSVTEARRRGDVSLTAAGQHGNARRQLILRQNDP